MIIDDKALQIQKKSCVNGKVLTWSNHKIFDVSFVCDGDVLVFIGSPLVARYQYDDLVKKHLNQIYQDNIVEGSLA